jgi:hypothetical protein
MSCQRSMSGSACAATTVAASLTSTTRPSASEVARPETAI